MFLHPAAGTLYFIIVMPPQRSITTSTVRPFEKEKESNNYTNDRLVHVQIVTPNTEMFKNVDGYTGPE